MRNYALKRRECPRSFGNMSQGPQEEGKIKVAYRPESKINTKVKDTLFYKEKVFGVSLLFAA